MEHSTFKKFDTEKPRFTIISDLLQELGDVNKVMEYGALKYGRDNWKKCTQEELNRYRDAAVRHLLASYNEKYDKESGYSHMAHLACNALFVMYLDRMLNSVGVFETDTGSVVYHETK
jgi:Domain of unknown function (DUF5664)